MERMGLGYKELRQLKPDIIMVSSCMMGQTGPYSRHPGYGRPLTALTGFTNITGWPDRDATELNVYTDFVAPHFSTLAILAALDYRDRTGKGQYIDISQYECCIHFMEPLILDYNINGRIANRNGNRNPYAVPHGVFRCQGEDTWCAIALFDDDEWGKLCKVVGSPAWTSDSRFATSQARKENEDELEKMIDRWTIKHPAEEVMRMMQAAGLAAGVLETGKELMEDDPQLKSRRFFWQLDHPEVGKYHAERPPFILSKSPCEVRRAPLLGEHNEYVSKEILGMSDEEFVELVLAEIIEST
jgi:benzylsuccinate CoA-transferase BbsF subunit